MKKIFTPLLLLLASAFVLPVEVMAAEDLGEPAIQYKSSRGTREKVSDRYVQIYLKSSVADTVSYIAVDDSIVPVTMTKAATLYNKKITVSKPEVTVKVYGKTISFINFNNNDAYDVQLGEDGNATIFEFRCEGDSLDNLDFITRMRALTYFVGNNNNRLQKDLVIKSATLQRLSLGNLNSVENLTVEAPEMYEFKVSSAALAKSFDLTKCAKIKTFNCYKLASLTSLKLSETLDEMTTFAIGGTQLTSLKMANYPLLKTLAFTGNDVATALEVKNCPELTTITANANNLTSFAVGEDLPKLTTVLISNPNLVSLDLKAPSITSVTCEKSKLKSVDLTSLVALKKAYFNNGVLEEIKIAPEAAENTLSSLYITNNNFALVNIPPRYTKMKPSSSYSTPYNYYAPQANPQVPQEINVGDKVDMSKYLYGQLYGTDSVVASTLKWTTKFDEELVEGVDYSVKDGVFTFLKAQEDSVCCTVTNPEFDWFKLYTDTKGTTYDYRIMTNYTFVNLATGVDGVAAKSAAQVKAVNGAIAVNSANGERVLIADVAGRVIWNARVADDATFPVSSKGIYVVSVGSKRTKVLVR